MNYAQTYAVFSFVVGILIASLLIPLSKTKNIALLTAIFWYVQGIIFAGVRAWVWSDNVIVRLEIFCDITLALRNCINLSLETCSLCIALQLNSIVSRRRSWLYPKYRVPFEIFMCIVLPCIYELLFLIVQPNRFQIVEGVGCQSPIYWSVPALVLIMIPLIVVAIIISVYAVITAYWYIRHRAHLAAFIGTRSYESVNSRTQWVRLGILLVFESVVSMGVSIWNVTDNGPLQAWVSWDWVHYGYDQIFQFPYAFLSLKDTHEIWAADYLLTTCGLVFFCLLALSRESMKAYADAGRTVWRFVTAKRMRLGPAGLPGPMSSRTRQGQGQSPVTPTFKVPPKTPIPRTSTDSISTSAHTAARGSNEAHVIDLGVEQDPEHSVRKVLL